MKLALARALGSETRTCAPFLVFRISSDSEAGTEWRASAPTHRGSKWLKPAKNETPKNSWNWCITLMPATVWQILSKTLIPGNGNQCTFAKICLEKFVKLHQVRNLFLAGFSYLEPLCMRRPLRFRGRFSFQNQLLENSVWVYNSYYHIFIRHWL